MKYIIMLSILVFLSACGKVETQTQYLTETIYKSQDFEGFYFCENNSTIELISDFNNRVTFETTGQSLNSVNPKNNTVGTHPVISDRDLIIIGNKLIISPRNYNYSSSTHDIEEDVSGSDINGNHRTDILVQKINGESIKINIYIWDNAINSNINEIIVRREFVCQM